MQKEAVGGLQTTPKKANKTLLIVLIITGVILILSIISAYLTYNYYSNKQGGNGPREWSCSGERDKHNTTIS